MCHICLFFFYGGFLIDLIRYGSLKDLKGDPLIMQALVTEKPYCYRSLGCRNT